ncbi:MAG: GEVED domain-containing protein, partial [Planctomycetota bacterium]
MANRNKKRRMKKKSRSSTRLGMESLEEKRLLTTCVDMEDLTLGQTYNVGDTFVADNTGFQANVRARQFTFSNGNTTAGGFARVENNNFAGHLGQDMQVNNILLDMTFNDPVNDGLTMNFGEFGGNLNLGLNGTFTNFENFNQLDGANIGGTQISVVNGFGNDQGTITFDGPINSFAIGGQELWIDHLCLNDRPQEGNLDWGDAPDGPNGPFYNTLASNGGAFHVIDDNVFLGEKVDPEADGQPNLAATGDDNNGAVPDDEDGVVFLTPIVPGQDARVEVTANDDGFLSAWMDFDRNGQWDPSDQIFTVEFLSPGSHVLSFPVPATAEPGTTYSRWRFTNEELVIEPKGAGNTFGEPMIGEVEDYRNEIEHERQDNPNCIEFEDLALGSMYFVGDLFTADNTGFMADFRGEPFTFSSGGTTSSGFALVENGGMAGAAGQDLQVNNILLNANFGGAIPGLSMEFGEFGGNLNIEINGDFRNFNNFQDINGAVIGGTFVTVPAGGFGNDQGELVVNGVINSFKIGGQELWIDHICQQEGQDNRLDWGDAPDGPNGPFYNTLAANNGAFHVIDDLVYLGSSVDPEIDGQPTLAADGDDTNGAIPDDEDGVRFLTPIVPGQNARVEVTANEDGYLSAWMDFDRSGTWDAGDQIYASQFLTAGVHLLSFPVPASAEPGTTYSRWRFTNTEFPIGPAGSGLPDNAPLIGEVEDYRNEIERQDDPNCIDFEFLPLGAEYFVGDMFNADPVGLSADFTGEPFTWSSGTVFAGGVARVDNGGIAGHVGQDIAVNNILMDVDFGGVIPGLEMNFGEFGGNLNIEINGDFRNFDNFVDINGAIIGGTIVSVPAGGFGNDQG